MHRLLPTLPLLGLLACSATVEEPAAPDGLTIDTRTEAHVTATFRKNGTGIRLELSKSPRHIAIRDLEDAPLLEAELGADLVETIRVLGGRETIVGTHGQEPAVTGDASAHVELSALPEAELIPEALAALPATDLAEDLYRAQPDVSAVFRSTTLYCGQVAYLPTYSIWWSHSFVRYNTHRTTLAWIHVSDLWAIWDEALLPGWYYNDYGPRWNFTLVVENKCYWGNTPVVVGSDAY